MPHYIDEEGHEMVLREVDGKDVLCRKYQKSYHIPKERSHHYNRKQATYQQIKDYIMKKYGLKIHTVYISEVKRMHGVEMQANRRKTDPKYECPQDKVAAIEDALRYFNIIVLYVTN